jgi:hypothetical protein
MSIVLIPVSCVDDFTMRWLYSLILTINANFRLKNKARGINNDRPLSDGWGHWVLETPYH